MNSLIRRVQFVWYQWSGTATRFPRVKLCCAGGACRRCSRLSWPAAVPISHRQEGPGSWVICWDRRAVPVPTCEGATGLCVTTVPPTPSRSPSKRCWCGPVRHCGCRVLPMDRLRVPSGGRGSSFEACGNMGGQVRRRVLPTGAVYVSRAWLCSKERSTDRSPEMALKCVELMLFVNSTKHAATRGSKFTSMDASASGSCNHNPEGPEHLESTLIHPVRSGHKP